mmetsp:Transcript_65191/g.212386  ORF Transcript_65191/g.212386 Transcript_65191/m.212386 type:complete len:233 (+) Transcript_65191:1746-2444(+)
MPSGCSGRSTSALGAAATTARLAVRSRRRRRRCTTAASGTPIGCPCGAPRRRSSAAAPRSAAARSSAPAALAPSPAPPSSPSWRRRRGQRTRPRRRRRPRWRMRRRTRRCCSMTASPFCGTDGPQRTGSGAASTRRWLAQKVHLQLLLRRRIWSMTASGASRIGSRSGAPGRLSGAANTPAEAARTARPHRWRCRSGTSAPRPRSWCTTPPRPPSEAQKPTLLRRATAAGTR